MTPPIAAAIFYAGWTLAIAALGIAAPRVVQVLLRRKPANSWTGGALEGPPLQQRITRAHANCVENLPVFAVVVFGLHLAQVSGPTIDQLAIAVAVARVGQTVVHIASGSAMAVNVRFTFYLAQIVCIVAMVAMAVV